MFQPLLHFITSFDFIIQRHRSMPIPLKMHVSLGSPSGRAPAVAGERVVVATICPLRRLRRHLSQRERLFVNPIITQIGRENKFSAEVFVPNNSPPRMQRELRVIVFYPCIEVSCIFHTTRMFNSYTFAIPRQQAIFAMVIARDT